MKIEKQSIELLSNISDKDAYKLIELAGRNCYKSEEKITRDSAVPFIRMLIDKKHESPLEHVSLTIRFITDRAIANELVRHRIASYSQESTRYVDYLKSEIIVIQPLNLIDDQLIFWRNIVEQCEQQYNRLRSLNVTPQIARSVLPLCLKTDLIATMNIRQWRNVLKQRLSIAAHPQMQDLMEKLLKVLGKKYPILFENIK